MAGIFYPDEKVEVEATLDHYGLAPAKGGTAKAIIAPHASWDISGEVAARAFEASAGRAVHTVVILAPIHEGHESGIYLSDSALFETPLGELDVDLELSEELESCGTCFHIDDIPHLEEHSLEILLPFIQRCHPKARIVPILIKGNRPSVIQALARGLDIVFAPHSDSTLFVVSTNLSAHLPTETANAHADAFLKRFSVMDGPGMIAEMGAGGISACGANATAALLSARLLSGTRARIIARCDSGSHSPDKVVSYAAMVLD